VSLTATSIWRSLVHLARSPLFISVWLLLSVVCLLVSDSCMILNSPIVVSIVIEGCFQIFARGVQVGVTAASLGALLIRSFLSPVRWCLLIIRLFILGRLLLIQILYVIFQSGLRLECRFSWLDLNTSASKFNFLISTNIRFCGWLTRCFLAIIHVISWYNRFLLLTKFVLIHQLFDGNSFRVFRQLACSTSSNYADTATKTATGTAYYNRKP
jgi:hypothetical protein